MIVFARPRHDYMSYTDLWTLISLSGFPLIYIDEIDPQDDEHIYIYSTPDVAHEWRGARAKIIFWLLEWYGDYWQRPGVSETWVSNRTFAEKVGARFVPMGSHPDLGNGNRLDPVYDIAHMSYADIHRRRLLINQLQDMGLQIAPNGWGETRDNVLRHSKVMLHIHQHNDYPAIAPLRASLAAAYKLPLIAENGWSIEPYDAATMGKYDHLPAVIVRALHDSGLTDAGARLHEKLCHELQFDKVVRAHV